MEPSSILIVDDNPLIINVLKSLFTSEGYHVVASANGAEAFGALESKNFDLIICDVMMPTMDGYELHKKVREQPDLAHIPFVFLTALGDAADINRGKETGADDYVVKPFDPHDLLALVKGKIVRSKSLRNYADERFDTYRKRVIHTLSHEFRTPLVAINTGTELLLEQKQALDVHKTQNLLEAIRRGGQRLEKLVTDFMLLQQIEAGIAERVYSSRKEPKVLATVVKEYVESRQELITKEGFSVAFVDNSMGAKVDLYEPQLMDILDRLVSNSIKFKSKDRTIELRVYTVEDEVTVEVRDRGIGIDPARVKEAIDLFGQLDREKLEQQGGGLGLAIANRYASINQGRLEFENREGGGSTVSIVLPKYHEAAKIE